MQSFLELNKVICNTFLKLFFHLGKFKLNTNKSLEILTTKLNDIFYSLKFSIFENIPDLKENLHIL